MRQASITRVLGVGAHLDAVLDRRAALVGRMLRRTARAAAAHARELDALSSLKPTLVRRARGCGQPPTHPAPRCQQRVPSAFFMAEKRRPRIPLRLIGVHRLSLLAVSISGKQCQGTKRSYDFEEE